MPDWLTDWLTDRQTDSLTDWLLDPLSLSSLWIIFWGHNFSSLSLCSLYVGSSNAIIKNEGIFRVEIWKLNIYIYARNSFRCSVESEFLLGYLNGKHRFSVGHKNLFSLVLLRAIYDFHTIKSLRLRRRWEMMRTEWSSSRSSTCPKKT